MQLTENAATQRGRRLQTCATGGGGLFLFHDSCHSSIAVAMQTSLGLHDLKANQKILASGMLRGNMPYSYSEERAFLESTSFVPASWLARRARVKSKSERRLR